MKALLLPVKLFLVVFAAAIACTWDLAGAVEYETNYCRCELYGEDLYGRTYVTPFFIVEGITVIPWYHGACRHHIMYQQASGGQNDYADPNYHRHLYKKRRKERTGTKQAANSSRPINEKQSGRKNVVEGTASGVSRRTTSKKKKRRIKEGKKALYTVGHRRLTLYQKQAFKGYHHWKADRWAKSFFSNENMQYSGYYNRDPPRTGYDVYSYDKSRNVFRCPAP
jgi:hypothetical protein